MSPIVLSTATHHLITKGRCSFYKGKKWGPVSSTGEEGSTHRELCDDKCSVRVHRPDSFRAPPTFRLRSLFPPFKKYPPCSFSFFFFLTDKHPWLISLAPDDVLRMETYAFRRRSAFTPMHVVSLFGCPFAEDRFHKKVPYCKVIPLILNGRSFQGNVLLLERSLSGARNAVGQISNCQSERIVITR